MPEKEEEKVVFAETLAKYGVSVKQYVKAYQMPDLTM